MIYSGSALNVTLLPSGIANLTFDLSDSSVNKFNEITLKELREAVEVLKRTEAAGLIFSSAKPTFIVGADITEFTGMFAESEKKIDWYIARIFRTSIEKPLIWGGFTIFGGMNRGVGLFGR